MSLEQELAGALAQHEERQRCSLCAALAAMTESESSVVQQALAGKLGARPLHKILSRNGYHTSREAVNLHRREDHRV